jgi:uncharacterized zinc-type alcohol dehydrogenase-like protein
MKIQAYSAKTAGGDLKIESVQVGALKPDQVDITVDYCGVCHSDLSMLGNDWGVSKYPMVPGHEVVGTVRDKGENVSHLEVGQKVGLGWFSSSCKTCPQCLAGDHNLCSQAEMTVLGQTGGFAEVVRAQALWAIPLPDAIDFQSAGPLFCGGITVFNPIVQNFISPTDRVGVVGIGGLGHMAVQFLNKWGCEVTAFSTSPEKEEETRKLGAHHFINSKDTKELKAVAGKFDLILVTVNVELDWAPYIAALAPRGKLHLVGAAPKVESEVFPLIAGQKSMGASPLGSPFNTARMGDFATRHQIAPQVEVLPMSDINKAFKRLEDEQPAHRLVLQADF